MQKPEKKSPRVQAPQVDKTPLAHQTLVQLLKPYRTHAAGSQGNVGVIISNTKAIKILAIWDLYPGTWKAPETKPPINLHDRWLWIWHGREVNCDYLAEITGLPVVDTERTLTILKNARLIFPDGTLAEPAQKILHNAVARHIAPRAGDSPFG